MRLKAWAWITTGSAFAISLISAAFSRPPFMETIVGIVGLTAIILWIAAYRKWRAAHPKPRTASRDAPKIIPPADRPSRYAETTWHQAGRATPARAVEPQDKIAASTGVPYFLLGSDGYTWMEVEGEFARTDAIQKVIGAKLRLDQEVELLDLPTELRPEPSNRYDRNAVMVIIDGWHVGYLPRDQAVEYHQPLARLVAAGVTPMVKGRVWAVAREDWKNGGTKLNARVSLAIGQPDRLAPMNNPPAAPYSLIPWGGGLQVTGEEKHLDALSNFVTPSGDSIAVGTLHALQVPAPKGATREVAELRLDGERVGQMTPASSVHFLPTIKHLEDQGRLTAVWVRVKGSAVAAQAVLQATKAHELRADWFGAASTIPALYPRQAGHAVESEVADDVAEVADAARPAPMWDD